MAEQDPLENSDTPNLEEIDYEEFLDILESMNEPGLIY